MTNYEDCDPDCAERNACEQAGEVGHSMCGVCKHGKSKHHGCNVCSQEMREARQKEWEDVFKRARGNV